MTPLEKTLKLIESIPIGTIFGNSTLDTYGQATPLQKEWATHRSNIAAIITFMWVPDYHYWFTLAGDAVTVHTRLDLPYHVEDGVVTTFMLHQYKEYYEKRAKDEDLFLSFY